MKLLLREMFQEIFENMTFRYKYYSLNTVNNQQCVCLSSRTWNDTRSVYRTNVRCRHERLDGLEKLLQAYWKQIPREI